MTGKRGSKTSQENSASFCWSWALQKEKSIYQVFSKYKCINLKVCKNVLCIHWKGEIQTGERKLYEFQFSPFSQPNGFKIQASCHSFVLKFIPLCCRMVWMNQLSRSVVSDSLWPHESQHTRHPCPSPTPGVHSNSCPSSQWCHLAILSSYSLTRLKNSLRDKTMLVLQV